VSALGGTATVSGILAGFASTTSRLFVAIAGASSAGGLVVLDVDCVSPTPAPTPAPTEAPSPAPTEGTVIWVNGCPNLHRFAENSEQMWDAYSVVFVATLLSSNLLCPLAVRLIARLPTH